MASLMCLRRNAVPPLTTHMHLVLCHALPAPYHACLRCATSPSQELDKLLPEERSLLLEVLRWMHTELPAAAARLEATAKSVAGRMRYSKPELRYGTSGQERPPFYSDMLRDPNLAHAGKDK